MKRIVYISVMTISLVSGSLFAQPAKEFTGTEAFRLRLLAAAKPTPDQEVQLDQILQTYRQAVENWHRQNDEKIKKLQQLQQDVLQSRDQGTLQAVQRDLRAMMESQRELRQTLLNQMEDVLDKEQFARVRQACKPEFAGPAVLEMLSRLQLTEGQHQQIQSLMDHAAEAGRSKTDPADREKAMNDAIEEIQQVVLTQPQRDTLQRLLRQAQQQERRRAMLRKMDFTPEQKSRMEAILADARQRAREATPQEKQAILAQAYKTIRRDVWTQQQREQYAMVLMEQYRQRLRSLGLSESQIAQAEKILADAQTQAQSAATVEEKRQILQDAVETIRRTVLRPEQRERLK